MDELNDIEVSPLQQKMDNFMKAKDSEEAQNILEFAKIHLGYEADIKEIRELQKENKANAKDLGVSVANVNKVIKALKDEAKETGDDVTEFNNIQKILKDDVNVQAMITSLIAK